MYKCTGTCNDIYIQSMIKFFLTVLHVKSTSKIYGSIAKMLAEFLRHLQKHMVHTRVFKNDFLDFKKKSYQNLHWKFWDFRITFADITEIFYMFFSYFQQSNWSILTHLNLKLKWGFFCLPVVRCSSIRIKEHSILKTEIIIFVSLNQRNEIIIKDLLKCLWRLELFLRWAMWPTLGSELNSCKESGICLSNYMYIM